MLIRPAAVTLAALALAATPALAQKGGGKGGGGGGGGGDPGDGMPAPVILAAARTHPDWRDWNGRNRLGQGAGRAIPVHMTDRGRDLTYGVAPSYDGDMTHGGGDRWIVDYMPFDDRQSTHISALSPDCHTGNPSYEAVLIDDPGFDYPSAGFVRWSPDGQRLAFSASHASAGMGVWVADVDYNGDGQPIGVSNLHLAISLTSIVDVSWAWDNSRVAFAAPGVGGLADVWVANVDTGAVAAATSSPEEEGLFCGFSRAAGDDRIVFTRRLDVGPEPSDWRVEVFVVDLVTMAETQVTDAPTASPYISSVEFSPDAQQIAFSAGRINTDPASAFGVYTISADGSNLRQLTQLRLKSGGAAEEDGVHGPIRWRE
ncbi:MAG: TolB family protein [Phycisphaerales bacterium JB039]